MATTTTTKKTASTATKKTSTKTGTAKKTTTTKNSTSTTPSFKVSAQEKQLVQLFRKCSMIEKQLILTAVEKCAESKFDFSAITKLIK